MKKIEFDGIQFLVPRNFPHAKQKTEKDDKILSFSLMPHENAKRYLHFFEVISTNKDSFDYTKLLPEKTYQINGKKEEYISIPLETDSTLKIVDLKITLPCGLKEEKKIYVYCYQSQINKKKFYFMSFTMLKKEFIKIIATVKCS
ncbi:MAG TPA: hypothetical protein QF753_18415 [Victivallales bacterium]|nr:hypothetical protein [Victivallales bacterium]